MKVGEFRLAQTSHAVSDTFLLGKSELTISGEHAKTSSVSDGLLNPR